MEGWHSFIGSSALDHFPGTTPLTQSEYEELTKAAIALGVITKKLSWQAVSDFATAFRGRRWPKVALRAFSILVLERSTRAGEVDYQSVWEVGYLCQSLWAMHARWLDGATYFTSITYAGKPSYEFAFFTRLYLAFKDAWVALLLHLIPNVQDICVLQMPSDAKTCLGTFQLPTPGAQTSCSIFRRSSRSMQSSIFVKNHTMRQAGHAGSDVHTQRTI